MEPTMQNNVFRVQDFPRNSVYPYLAYAKSRVVVTSIHLKLCNKLSSLTRRR